MKTCSNCGVEKPLDMFHKEALGKYGVRANCKECQNKRQKKHSQRPEVKERRAKWQSKKYHACELHRLKHISISRMHLALKRLNMKKVNSTVEYLGVDMESYKRFLEYQFTPEMTWDNQGSVWHIDHIIPLASANEEWELIDLLHFTNTQPMLAEENLSKGSLHEGKRHKFNQPQKEQ